MPQSSPTSSLLLRIASILKKSLSFRHLSPSSDCGSLSSWCLGILFICASRAAPERTTQQSCFRADVQQMRRHEALRTTFVMIDGQPSQVIAVSVSSPVDLRELPAAEREVAAQQMASESAQRPFTLSAGPLLRVMPPSGGSRPRFAAESAPHC